MCVLSPNDQPVPTSYTAADLDFDLSLTVKRVEALAAVVKAAAFGGKGDACGRSDLYGLALHFERSIQGFREGLCLALTGREPPQGNAPALVAAIREFTEERAIAAGVRPRDPLTTAMRRVDAAEAAERPLIDVRRDVVANVAASLPPYDAGAVAPCADLARAAEGHPYGKCGTVPPASMRSHGAYEAGFHPSSAA